MAILAYHNGDAVVSTIAARDALPTRIHGMEVTVLDSIADILTGGGEAGYQWNAVAQQWILIWKTTSDNLTFVTETKLIVAGNVTSDYIPYNGLVWNAFVTDSLDVFVANVYPTLVSNELSLDTNSFDGQFITYTYGYNLIDAAVALAVSNQAAIDQAQTAALSELIRLSTAIPIIETLIVSNDKIVLTYPPVGGLNGVLNTALVKRFDAGGVTEAPVLRDPSDSTGKTFIISVDFAGQWNFDPVVIQYLHIPPAV
jgi:hypothetical protein